MWLHLISTVLILNGIIFIYFSKKGSVKKTISSDDHPLAFSLSLSYSLNC